MDRVVRAVTIGGRAEVYGFGLAALVWRWRGEGLVVGVRGCAPSEGDRMVDRGVQLAGHGAPVSFDEVFCEA